MSALLERAAKARGATAPSLKRDRGVVPPRPTATASPASPSPKTSKRPGVVEKESVSASRDASRFEFPLGSGLGSSDQDELVSRFAAACPGGSLEHMAGVPSDILVSKGAAILAEVGLTLSFLCPAILSEQSFQLIF